MTLSHFLPPSVPGCFTHQGPGLSLLRQIQEDTKNAAVINGDRLKCFYKQVSANSYSMWPSWFYFNREEAERHEILRTKNMALKLKHKVYRLHIKSHETCLVHRLVQKHKTALSDENNHQFS